MAFNGSGTFNLITGNPVVTGTTISSTWANNTLTDVASGLTNCVTRDGQSPATANLPMGNYKLTGVGAPTASGDALVFGQNASIATLKLLGSSSGFVGLKGAAAAGSTTYTWPASDGSVGQALLTDGAGNLSFGSAGFASGTAMLFAQTAAPTGWTKSTSHDNKALRIVSGTASSGGSAPFTTAFASQTPAGSINVSGGSISAYTLTTSDIPSHTHNWGGTTGNAGGIGSPFQVSGSTQYATSATGGGGSHAHGFTNPTATFSGSAINLAVQYVDAIIATKD